MKRGLPAEKEGRLAVAVGDVLWCRVRPLNIVRQLRSLVRSLGVRAEWQAGAEET
jgi:hypothetical protein